MPMYHMLTQKERDNAVTDLEDLLEPLSLPPPMKKISEPMSHTIMTWLLKYVEEKNRGHKNIRRVIKLLKKILRSDSVAKLQRGTLNPSDVLPFVNRGLMDFVGNDKKTYRVQIGHRDIRTFARQPACVQCGLKGSKFLLFPSNAVMRHKDKRSGRLVFMGTKDNGEDVLMTIDHIQPRSKNGSNSLKNLQTMCRICNMEKGDKI